MVILNFNNLYFLIYYSSYKTLSNLYCHTYKRSNNIRAKERYFKCMQQNPSRNANCTTLCHTVQSSFLTTVSLNERRKLFCLISDFHDKACPPYLGLSVSFWHIRFWHSKSQAIFLWSCNSKYFHFLLYTLLATAVQTTHKPTSPLPTPQLGN